MALALVGIRIDAVGGPADFEVVGETADGLSVSALVERLEPEVLIVGVAMPGLSGLEITRQGRERSPKTAVIVLSRYVNEWYVTEALRNGASGYVGHAGRGSRARRRGPDGRARPALSQLAALPRGRAVVAAPGGEPLGEPPHPVEVEVLRVERVVARRVAQVRLRREVVAADEAVRAALPDEVARGRDARDEVPAAGSIVGQEGVV